MFEIHRLKVHSQTEVTRAVAAAPVLTLRRFSWQSLRFPSRHQGAVLYPQARSLAPQVPPSSFCSASLPGNSKQGHHHHQGQKGSWPFCTRVSPQPCPGHAPHLSAKTRGHRELGTGSETALTAVSQTVLSTQTRFSAGGSPYTAAHQPLHQNSNSVFFSFYHTYLCLVHNVEADGGDDAHDRVCQQKDHHPLPAPQGDL